MMCGGSICDMALSDRPALCRTQPLHEVVGCSPCITQSLVALDLPQDWSPAQGKHPPLVDPDIVHEAHAYWDILLQTEKVRHSTKGQPLQLLEQC